jgi:tRNA threonylcarbamoyladenosine biosynthesis protein TsaE
MNDSNECLTVVTASEDDTRRLGECLAAALRPEQAAEAVVVAISGDLGAGKTRLVRGLAGGLGVDMQAIASPTFVLCVEHRGADGVRLAHIDAWRVRSADDLETIGWSELLGRPRTVVAVEWAERVTEAMPTKRIDVLIEHVGEQERSITITDRRSPADDREALLRAMALYEPAPIRPVDTGRVHRCPVCGSATTDANGSESAAFPFCSSRCRMADLHRWFGGSYTISRPTERDEELTD